MPNHFHIMVYANEKSIILRKAGNLKLQELSYRIGILLSSYSQALNKLNGTNGSLFQQKTKAKNLSDKHSDYIINCMHYIHQNAWKAGLVCKIEHWKYSSFPDYCNFRKGTLCNKSLLAELTGYDLNKFYQDSYEVISEK